VDRLDLILEECRRSRSRLGYFAALYRNVTVRVMEEIHRGRFQDGPRMERLDVIFANRYLEAYHAFRVGGPVTRSWREAFGVATEWRPVVLQHLLLGMNAHINLDLGIAAAETSPGVELPGLRDDFVEITLLLGEMLELVQGALGRVSPWMGLLDRAGGRTDDRIVTFGLARAREVAWRGAEQLARLPAVGRPTAVDALDRGVAVLARPILRPPGRVLPSALLTIRVRESDDVPRVIDALLL